MNPQLKTRGTAGCPLPTFAPDGPERAIPEPMLQEQAPQSRRIPALEQEVELSVRVPPKKTVFVTAAVIGRSRAEPDPILDL
jgi:hypothetical protein